jgi:hypothetical protein
MKKINFFCLIPLFLVIQSCSLAYIPNVVNTPMLSDRGDLKAAVAAGVSGVDFQLSGAVTDHIGLMLNGNFAAMPDLTDESNDFRSVISNQVVNAPGASGSGEQHFFY